MPNHSYYYYVQACNQQGCSEASAGTYAALLSGSGGLQTSRQATDIRLAWEANALATSYDIYRGTSQQQQDASLLVSNIATTSYLDTTPAIDTRYFYFIQACNANGCNDAASGSAALLSKPLNLAATRQATALNVFWTTNQAASSYKLYRSLTDSFSAATPLVDNLSNASHLDSTPEEDTPYFYFVEACNSTGCSDTSDSIEAALLSQPATLLASKQGSAISLSWNANALASNYTLSRATSDDFSQAQKLSDAITSTSYQDSGAQLNNLYYYFVQACNANGCSEPSDSRPSNLLSIPINLQATSQGATVSLSWSANSLATNYKIFRSHINDFNAASTLTEAATTNSFIDNSSTSGSLYFYFVQACNQYSCSDPSSSRAIFTPPVGLSAEISYPNVTLNWEAR